MRKFCSKIFNNGETMTAQELKIEFENELKGTRRVLEAVDFEKVDYKPHPKSFAFGDLTAHLSNVASWGLWTVKHNEYRMTAGDAQSDRELPDTKEELLSKFDAVVAEFLQILGGLTPSSYRKPGHSTSTIRLFSPCRERMFLKQPSSTI